ncbi:MAG: 6-phosphogluconolactonase [Acidobacteriota bacterium]|nr:6-phosphogluconolactonase [Acidobacteriota bacterium]
MKSEQEIHIFRDQASLFQSAAGMIAEIANAAVADHGRFTFVLSGGSSPKGLFTLLAGGKVPPIPWNKAYFFWGDERHVPPDDPESNYRMARESMLTKLGVPEDHIFRVHSEDASAESAARNYEEQIKSSFNLNPGEFPRFDLVLLGMGPDGHTASLFPLSGALQEKSHLVVANWVEKFKTDRITMTFPVLNNAATAMFLATGEEKAPILREVLENSASGLPAQKVRPTSGKLVWILDESAASQLSPQTIAGSTKHYH